MRKLTPPELARLYGVNADKVLAWIHNGELRAINVATSAAGRPRYRIDEADLAAFELRRQANAKREPSRARRKKLPADIIEFF